MGLAQGGIFHMELWRQDDMLNGERILSGNVRRASVPPSLPPRVSACLGHDGTPPGVVCYPTGHVLLGLFFLTFQLETSSSEAAQPGPGGFRGNPCLP